jgi:6-phosphogluconate dehydrogenase
MAKKRSTTKKDAPADIGLIGLAVMGQNLALNIADHGYTVAVFNRTTSKMTDFIARCEAEEPSKERVLGYKRLGDFIKSIKRPRKVIIMVQAGRGTDAVIDQLVAAMDKGDIIIDGGNANWNDTIRREKDCRARGFEFIGTGVSGGETGARFGPSTMPGGSPQAWKHLQPIWKAISAKVDRKTGRELKGAEPGKPIKGGESCTALIGPNGAGHYVKMVHNGIEYIDMQLICEAYSIMKNLLGMNAGAIGQVFDQWNQGELSSYLIEITADILQQKDPTNKRRWLVDQILDTAGQKGTGKWTSISALDLGIPANSIAEAVFARCLSALKEERVAASKQLRGPKAKKFTGGKKKVIEDLRKALYCAKICAYAQGFQLMAEAQVEYDWKLNFGQIAKIWRGGCIIRARFLQKITDAFAKNRKLPNLMLDPYFKRQLHGGQESWRDVVALCVKYGVSSPAFSSALAYYDGYRSAVLPANLLQGQRDYFGAHTYERVDQPRGKFFHVDWPEPDRPQLPA